MERVLRPNSAGNGFRSVSSAAINKFLIAGVTVAGAAAIAVNPVLSTSAANTHGNAMTAAIQQREVKLVSDITDIFDDYESVFATAGANLQTLGTDAATALPALAKAVVANLSQFGSLFSTAFSATETALQNTFYGGWYGGDDGYVFGLFGGTITANGVTESGSTLQEVFSALASGNVFNAFSYIEEWALEALQHDTKPLLAPFLNEAKAGVAATATIPGLLFQTATTLFNTIFTYSNLQATVETVLSPAVSLAYGTLGAISNIGTALKSGNIGGVLADILKLPADLTGDLLNGYVYPSSVYNPTNAHFTGLLNTGSLLMDLLFTWPEKLITALTPATTAAAATTTAAAAATVTNAAVKTVAAVPAATTSTAATTDTATTTSTKKQGKKVAHDASGDTASGTSIASATDGDATTSATSKTHEAHGKPGSSSSTGTSSSTTSSSSAKTHEGHSAGSHSESHSHK